MSRKVTYHQLNLNRELRVVRLTGDCVPHEGPYTHLRTLVEECEDLYPGIDLWFKQKVKPGLESKRRAALLVYHHERPIGAALVRRGEDAKLCSMRILPDEQHKGIGSLLMGLIAAEVRSDLTGRMHFTIPEELWCEKEGFFSNYRFVNQGPAAIQYRLFDQELACSADFKDVWTAVVERLPRTIEAFTLSGNSAHCDLVLSVHPPHAAAIASGEKSVEVRRSFPKKWKGASALLYATKPQQHFVGEAIIREVIIDSPETIWSNWKTEIQCTAEEFAAYCRGASQVSALILSDVRPFKSPIPKTQMEHLIQKDIKAPQSYCEVREGTVWPTALSLSCLLLSIGENRS